jgi:hypothetical protein
MLRDYAGARRSLTGYLHEGGAVVPAERRAQVMRQLAELKRHTQPGVSPPSAVAARSGSSAQLDAGGAVQSQQPDDLSIRHGGHGTVVLAWISTGVLGLGALGTGVGTWIAARDYEDSRRRPAAPGSAESVRAALDAQRDRVRTLGTVTDVLALAAIGSAVFSVIVSSSEPAAQGSAQALALELTPGRLRVAGSF